MISPEHNGGDSVDCEKKPDDEGVAVEQNPSIFQNGSQGSDRDGQLDETSDEPGHPVDGVIQAHHLHHLQPQKENTRVHKPPLIIIVTGKSHLRGEHGRSVAKTASAALRRLSDLFEPLLLLSDDVLNHHGHGVNPGDHHAQRHHVLDHKQEAEKRRDNIK